MNSAFDPEERDIEMSHTPRRAIVAMVAILTVAAGTLLGFYLADAPLSARFTPTQQATPCGN